MNIQDVKNSNWSKSINELGGIVEGYDDISQCMGIILTTVQGSVPGDPEFGCGIYTMTDRSASNVGQMVKLMADALTKYEPRITIRKFVYELIVNEVGQYVVRFKINWTTDIREGSRFQYTVLSVAEDDTTQRIGFDYTFDFQLS
jgi:phage baseplate assembly protein W